MFARVLDTDTGLFRNQRFVASRPFNEDGFKAGSTITVEIRFDDECKNAKQSFAITGHVQEPRARDYSMGGCIHEEIAKYFPELAPFIKWHLFDSNGPMHYVANAVYHASNRDSSGYAAGEPCQWDTKLKFGDFPITFKYGKKFREWLFARIKFNKSVPKTNPNRVDWLPVAIEHDKKPGDTYDFAPKFTLNGFDAKWHECPFDTLEEAQGFCEALTRFTLSEVKTVTGYSKGKERDLKAARSCAVWPDATDTELCVPRKELEAALLARLPALVAEFTTAITAAGFLLQQEV